MTRRVLFEDLVGTRGELDIMLVGFATDVSTPFPSLGERGVPPDAVAYESGVVVKVIDGIDGPLRVRTVLANCGDRNRGTPPALITRLAMSPRAWLTIGKDESDTGHLWLKPSVPDGALVEVCVTVLERTSVLETNGPAQMPSAIEIQIGDPDATVIEHVRDDNELWRDLIEPQP